MIETALHLSRMVVRGPRGAPGCVGSAWEVVIAACRLLGVSGPRSSVPVAQTFPPLEYAPFVLSAPRRTLSSSARTRSFWSSDGSVTSGADAADTISAWSRQSANGPAAARRSRHWRLGTRLGEAVADVLGLGSAQCRDDSESAVDAT